jgi:aryl-alcohol dehydrogenase-like predicted oxidoreductase
MDMGEGRVGLKPAYIARAVEDSLRRLQTDYIDLYQSHKDDPDTPQAETLGAYARLIEAGKVRVIGASNYDPTGCPRRSASARPRAPALRKPAARVQPRGPGRVRGRAGAGLRGARGRGYHFFSLAAGFLTGKYRSEADFGKSARGARSIGRYMNERGMRILAALDAIAAEHGTVPATVALAWLMAKPTVTAADRQRDIGGAARDAGGRDAPGALGRGREAAGRRERLTAVIPGGRRPNPEPTTG